MNKIIQPIEHTIDAANKTLGRLATEISVILQGKDHASYQTYQLSQNTVRVKNIQALRVTGKKADQKIYYKFSGYPGGIKTKKLRDCLQLNPEKLLRQVVSGMLPSIKNKTKLLQRLIIEQ